MISKKIGVLKIILFLSIFLLLLGFLEGELCVSDDARGECGYCATSNAGGPGYYIGGFAEAWCTGTSGWADALCWPSECVGGVFEEHAGCWSFTMPTKVDCCTNGDCGGACSFCDTETHKCKTTWGTTFVSDCSIYSSWLKSTKTDEIGNTCCGDNPGECPLYHEPYYTCMNSNYPHASGGECCNDTTYRNCIPEDYCPGGTGCCDPTSQCFSSCYGGCYAAQSGFQENWECDFGDCYFINGKPNWKYSPLCPQGTTCESHICVSTSSTCGNELIESGESCDDGNLINGDGCSSNCAIESGYVCGNELIESGESCDDGNLINGDGCSSTCMNESGHNCNSVVVCSNYINQEDCTDNICNIDYAGEDCGETEEACALVPGCYYQTDCNCKWNTATATCSESAISSSNCTGLECPSSLGECNTFQKLQNGDNCDDGFLIYNLTNLWDWKDNSYSTKTHFSQNQSLDGKWHFPSTSFNSCVNITTSRPLPCPTDLSLPFSGTLQLVATLIIIALIYYFILRKNKNLPKKKVKIKKR